jgi:hypothetical protein
MVDRGGCTFVQKVRNAQRSGAAGVLIADNTCLCSDESCTAANVGTSCEMQEPIMADDGSGSDISIPSFLLFKVDADVIKEELKASRPVQVEMKWSLPAPDDRVEYDLWTVPGDAVSKEFFTNFKKLAIALGEHAYFTPHMYIYDGVRSHCQGSGGENFCYNLCTNNGRYCATDPDNDLDAGISGADVVKESLRRLCIWNHYGATDGIGIEWWNYVEEFSVRCSDSDYFSNDACIQDAYKHAGVDGDTIRRCMLDSGGTDTDTPNNKFDNEIQSQTQRGVVVIPTAYVNTAAIRGALTSTNVFTAICAGFSEGTKPDICLKCGNCPNAVSCVEQGKCTATYPDWNTAVPSQAGVSTHTFASSMLFVICLFTGLGVWHYKRTREDMRDQVRGILAEYMPLEDHEQANGSIMSGNPMDFARGGASTSLIS